MTSVRLKPRIWVKWSKTFFLLRFFFHPQLLPFLRWFLGYFGLLPVICYILDRIHKHLNRTIHNFLVASNGLFYYHIDLEGFILGLYRSDLVHLSNIGLNIFNVGLQNIIVQVMVLGGPQYKSGGTWWLRSGIGSWNLMFCWKLVLVKLNLLNLGYTLNKHCGHYMNI